MKFAIFTIFWFSLAFAIAFSIDFLGENHPYLSAAFVVLCVFNFRGLLLAALYIIGRK